MIRIIHGINGQGKSLMAAEIMTYFPLMMKLATNMRLTPAHPRYQDAILIGGYEHPISCTCGAGMWRWAGWGQLTNTAFVIDEADLYFDSFKYAELREEGYAFFKQQRKRGFEFVFVLQFLNTLYNRLRDLAAENIMCHRDEINGHWSDIFMPEFMLGWRRSVFRDPECKNLIRQAKLSPREAATVFPSYDTRQQIERETACIYCQGTGEPPKKREHWTLAREKHLRAELKHNTTEVDSDDILDWNPNGKAIKHLQGDGSWI